MYICMSRKLRRNHWLICTHRYFQLNSPLHGSAQLRLLDLQLGQQIDEPLKGSLIPVYPKEVHLAQVHHRLGYLAGPLELASRTAVPSLPVSVHYGLSRGLFNKIGSFELILKYIYTSYWPTEDGKLRLLSKKFLLITECLI